MSFFVYILASRRNGTLYIGMTDNLPGRVWQHQAGVVPAFTKKYGVTSLVWFEVHDTREAAIQRERQFEVESALEVGADRDVKSGLARPDVRNLGLKNWVPAFAGTNG